MTGRFDKRRMPRPRERPGRAEIYSFLWHVYAHVAEARPDDPASLGSDSEGKELRAFLDASAELGAPFGADFSAAHTPSANLPRRSLPPGCPKHYYFL